MDGYLLLSSVRAGHSTNKLLISEGFSNKNTVQDWQGGDGVPRPNDPSRATSSIGCPLEGRGQRGLAPSLADLHVRVIQPCIRISPSLHSSVLVPFTCWIDGPVWNKLDLNTVRACTIRGCLFVALWMPTHRSCLCALARELCRFSFARRENFVVAPAPLCTRQTDHDRSSCPPAVVRLFRWV